LKDFNFGERLEPIHINFSLKLTKLLLKMTLKLRLHKCLS